MGCMQTTERAGAGVSHGGGVLGPAIPLVPNGGASKPVGEVSISVLGIDWTTSTEDFGRKIPLLQRKSHVSLRFHGSDVQESGRVPLQGEHPRFVLPVVRSEAELFSWVTEDGGEWDIVVYGESESLQVKSDPVAAGACTLAKFLDLKSSPPKDGIRSIDILVPLHLVGPQTHSPSNGHELGMARTRISLLFYSSAQASSGQQALQTLMQTSAKETTSEEGGAASKGAELPLKEMMDALRKSILTYPNQGGIPAEQDYERSSAMKVSGDRNVSVKYYGPKVFGSMRLRCAISDAEFADAWDLPDSSLSLALGAGRSGSLFLNSKEKNYLLKTIPHDEVETFLALLPDYYSHLAQYPSSMIMRVYGLWRLKSPGNSTYVLIFNNILDPKGFSLSPEVFDLKGRVVKRGKALQRRMVKGTVWKDKDLERFFYLSDPNRDLWLTQLKADVFFLEQNNMMDYSFLVGVRKLPENLDIDPDGPQKTQPSDLEGGNAFRSQYGGMGSSQSSGVHEVYYMGIIDCLTNYSGKKKVANLCKSFLWETDSLSTVPSQQYSERFMKFMQNIFPDENQALSLNLAESHPNSQYFNEACLVPFTPAIHSDSSVSWSSSNGTPLSPQAPMSPMSDDERRGPSTASMMMGNTQDTHQKKNSAPPAPSGIPPVASGGGLEGSNGGGSLRGSGIEIELQDPESSIAQSSVS